MHLKNGIWVRGPVPQHQPKNKNKPKKNPNGPKIITHRSQRTVVPQSTKRLDALMKGQARLCFQRRLGGLGDIIMATPIARGARRKFPGCHVTFSVDTSYANGDLPELLRYNPFIDEVIDYRQLDRDQYDAFKDITTAGLQDEQPHTNFPNRIDLFARYAGIPLFNDFLPIYVMTEDEADWGKGFIEKAIGNKKPRAKIAIHLRSNDPKRTWPPENVREFLQLADQKGFHCFLFEWGEDPDKWKIKGTTLVFNYKVRLAAAVLKQCDVLVCPDSYMLHLGGALNMRIVSLFGSMPPACRINHYPNAIAVVNQQLSCIGCVYSSCPNNYYCMKSISAKAVLEAVGKKVREDVVGPATSAEPEDDLISPVVAIKRSINTFRI